MTPDILSLPVTDLQHVKQEIDNITASAQYLVARLLAVWRIGGIAVEDEVLVRKSTYELFEHADAADPRVEHANISTVFRRHVSPT